MLKIILAGGGTLGSVSPLLAIAQSYPGAQYVFVGTKKGIEKNFLRNTSISYEYVSSVKLRRYVSWRTIIELIFFPVVIVQALRIIQRHRPDMILSSGGFVAVPIGLAGRLLGVPLIIHQQDIKIGLANQFLKIFADTITVTFDFQKKLFPSAKTILTGNPVRSLESSMLPDESTILILGGSQGARAMNRALAAVIPSLAEKYHIIHVLGKKNMDQALSIKNYEPCTFLTDSYADAVRKATIVITRAGMSTITELAFLEKPSILIPIPDSHQEDNARFFEANNAAINCKQDPSEIRSAILSFMHDEKKRDLLSKNLKKLFPQQANKSYIDVLKSFIKETHKLRTVHLVGIGGIGLSALARYFLSRGYRVTGSDLTHNTVTSMLETIGCSITYSHNKKNLPRNTEFIVYSDSVPSTNPELEAAAERHIPSHTLHEYLGILTSQHKTIAVSGTHGKTTTTSLLGYIASESDLDPTVLVGALVPQFGNSNFLNGNGNIFILEADEYRGHMLKLNATIAVITNIDADHLDFYKNIDDITEHFQRFCNSLPNDGILITSSDDARTSRLTASTVVTFGVKSNANYRAEHITIKGPSYIFDVKKDGKYFGTFTLNLIGTYNIMNALAAIATADQLGISVQTIKHALRSFTGVWRRLEKTGTFNGVPVYSDYAHHPTEILSTLRGLKEHFPKKHIITVYQPHSYDRTSKLLSDFAHSFSDTDTLILSEIYDVAGRDTIHTISSKKLFDRIAHNDAYYKESLEEIPGLLKEIMTDNCIIVCMGAGSIDSLARTIVKR